MPPARKTHTSNPPSDSDEASIKSHANVSATRTHPARTLRSDEARSSKPAFRPPTLHHRSSTCTQAIPLHTVHGLPIIPHAHDRPAALAGDLNCPLCARVVGELSLGVVMVDK